ncbi:hypothetical protein [Lentimonas sp. CC10]|uniref:hypothetical protein n=1 Tax=Lentimonas sp. CC10 TaxID=2676095 RepID=UPI001A7E6765|nr:hypothetical protein [Lentimonas sp. CC10]
MVQINTSDDLVEQIDELGVAETVKLHRKPPLPTRILRDLYELYHDQDIYLEFLAHYPLIPSDLADQIATKLDPKKSGIAVGLASNPRCPQQALNRLVKHKDVTVRHTLSTNSNLTPKEFQILVEDENPYVRAAVAQNAALPVHLQFILADDESSAVRISLANRKTLDLDIAVHLAESDDTAVRAAVILHCKLDDELLQLWADGDDLSQQLLLLRRKDELPQSAQTAIHFSTHSFACRTALARRELNGPEMLFFAESDDTRDRIFLAEYPDLPASIQRILAQDISPKVRRRLAANTSLHESIALHIAASSDLGSCRALAKNPSISDEVIAHLCAHPEDEIALLVTYRDDLTDTHRDLLINQRDSLSAAEHFAYLEIEYSNTSEAVAEQLAQNDAPTLRAFSATSINLSSRVRARLAADMSDSVRLAIASNTTLDDTQLKRLCEDTNREVVFAAEETYTRRLRERSPEPTTPSAETQREAPRKRAKSKPALFKKIVKFFGE